MKIGLTLPSRGVMFGATTPEQLLQLAELADRSGVLSSVWVGDSLLAAPRLDSVALLCAIAGRTRRVRLGTACMASFTLRDPVMLASQWAGLDLLSGGRSVLVACTGLADQAGVEQENRLYNLTRKDRVQRLIEWITIIRRLWTEDDVTFEGRHYRFANLTLEPKPAARPHPPIWIASNAYGERARIERSHRRIARRADGWQTSIANLDELCWRIEDIRGKLRELGRDPSSLAIHLYHNINIQDDRAEALRETREFFDTYYMMRDAAPREAEIRTAMGSPEECAEHLRAYAELGVDEIALRIVSWDQVGQLERLIGEVAPLLT